MTTYQNLMRVVTLVPYQSPSFHRFLRLVCFFKQPAHPQGFSNKAVLAPSLDAIALSESNHIRTQDDTTQLVDSCFAPRRTNTLFGHRFPTWSGTVLENPIPTNRIGTSHRSSWGPPERPPLWFSPPKRNLALPPSSTNWDVCFE